MREPNFPRNRSSLAILVFAGLVLFMFAVGILLHKAKSNSSSDGAGQETGEFDERESVETVAGITDVMDEEETDENRDENAEEPDDPFGDVETALEPSSGFGIQAPSVPIRSPITPVSPLDPSKSEFLSGFLPIHQRDMLSRTGEDYVFIPVKMKSGDQDLSVHIDYVAPTNPYVNKAVMGFAPYWSLSNYSEYQMERLSVIAYFSVAVLPDGNFMTVCNGSYCGDKYGWDGWNSTQLENMIELAHANGVKVVLTIKNFDKASIENLITSPTAQATLVVNIISEITAKNADGVNIDYEYIGTASTDLRAAFASSMDAIADSVHAARPGSHVSTDILGSSAMSPLLYDVTLLGQTSLDSIMVMSYDFYSTRYYDGKIAAPTSPLFGSQYWYTVSEAMLDIIASVPAGKVIMGVPYYGLEFPVLGDTWTSKNALVVSSGAIATYANVMNPVFDPWHNDSTIQWDEGEKMTWYRYRWPDAVSGPEYWQGYYDDARSLRAKYDFVIQNGIGGIGIWALGYDAGRTELWDVLRDSFSKEPIVVLFNTGVSEVQQNAVHSALSADVVRPLSTSRGVIVRPRNITSQELITQYNARAEVSQAGFLPYRSLQRIGEYEIEASE